MALRSPYLRKWQALLFSLYRAKLLVLPSRSFPKVRHLHIIKLLRGGGGVERKLLLLRKCWRNGFIAQKVQKSKKEVKLSFCIRGVMIKFALHNLRNYEYSTCPEFTVVAVCSFYSAIAKVIWIRWTTFPTTGEVLTRRKPTALQKEPSSLVRIA